MCEAAMAPEVAVVNAEVETDDVEVGNDRTNSAGYPDALRRTGTIKACPNAEGGYAMRKD